MKTVAADFPSCCRSAKPHGSAKIEGFLKLCSRPCCTLSWCWGWKGALWVHGNKKPATWGSWPNKKVITNKINEKGYFLLVMELLHLRLWWMENEKDVKLNTFWPDVCTNYGQGHKQKEALRQDVTQMMFSRSTTDQRKSLWLFWGGFFNGKKPERRRQSGEPRFRFVSLAAAQSERACACSPWAGSVGEPQPVAGGRKNKARKQKWA